MSKFFATKPRTSLGDVPSAADLAAVPTGSIALRDLIKPMREVWPAIDAVNGPWMADSGLVNAAPATAGRTLYAWNSGVFNLQSQNWIATPQGANMNNSGFSAAMNAPTCRTYGYGFMGNTTPLPSTVDFGFISDATEVTVFYYFYNAYTASNQNYHDMQWYSEHQGQMMKHNAEPVPSNVGGGLFYRTMTYKQSRSREHRIMLGPNCFIIGVYVPTTATIRKSPNKLLVLTNGDSWNEPNGAILATAGGAYGTAGGTHSVGGLSQMIAEQTGWAVGLVAAGGTGEFNAIDGNAHDENYADGGGNTVFHGVLRVNDMATKFFARNPIVFTIGGWNDGSLSGAPYAANYQARVAAGIARLIAKKADIKLMYAGIQPVNLSAGDARDQCMTGQQAAYAAAPALNMVGYMSLKGMWIDSSMSGQRGANVNNTDNIHLTDKGADQVAGWLLGQAAPWTIPTAYYAGCLAAAN